MATYTVTTGTSIGTATTRTRVANAGPAGVRITYATDRYEVVFPGNSTVIPATGRAMTASAVPGGTAVVTTSDASDRGVPGIGSISLDDVDSSITNYVVLSGSNLYVPVVHARQFGADPTGVTDSTVALQSFIDYVQTNQTRGLIDAGTYKITAALNIAKTPYWHIGGPQWGKVTLKQYTDNTPILSFNDGGGSNCHTFTLENMVFDYANTQPNTNTLADCIYFGAECYWGAFKSLRFQGGRYGTRVGAGVWSPWGTTWEDISFGGTLTGGAMWWYEGYGGTPNNKFGRMVTQCFNMVGPVFGMRGYNFVIDTIEFLSANQGPVLFQLASGGNVKVGSFKLEIGAYASGQADYLFRADSNSYMDIGSITVGGTTMTVTDCVPEILYAQAGAYIRCGYVTSTLSGFTNGFLYTAHASAAPCLEIGHVTFGTAGSRLSNYDSTTSPDYVKVSSWQNGRMSPDKGDADYTVTLGDANIIRYATALTAPRKVILPLDGGRLHNGLYYEILSDGAINGSNTIAVEAAGGHAITTLTTDKRAVRFNWTRIKDNRYSYNGWQCTRNTPIL